MHSLKQKPPKELQAPSCPKLPKLAAAGSQGHSSPFFRPRPEAARAMSGRNKSFFSPR